MKNLTTKYFCRKYRACKEGRTFAIKYATMADVWGALMRGEAGDISSEWAFWIIAQDGVLDKKERVRIALFCANRVRHLMSYKRSINALDVCQRYIDGEANDDELRCAARAAYAASCAADRAVDRAATNATIAAAAAANAAARAAYYATDYAPAKAAAAATNAAAYAADRAAYYAAHDAERAAQLEFLRTLPNPFGGTK